MTKKIKLKFDHVMIKDIAHTSGRFSITLRADRETRGGTLELYTFEFTDLPPVVLRVLHGKLQDAVKNFYERATDLAKRFGINS